MLKKLADNILGEGAGNPTIAGWVAGFAVIVLLRSFLELFSSTPNADVFTDRIQNVHFFLFYLATTLLLTLNVSMFTKQRGNRVINLALTGLPIIFLAPIIDLTTGALIKHKMGYLFDTHSKLFFDFLTFFGPFRDNGITLGMRVEIFIILCAIGWYVWIKNKDAITTFGAVLASYVLIFIMCALPGVLYSISHLPNQGGDASRALSDFYVNAVVKSNIPANMLHSMPSEEPVRAFTQVAGAMISQVLFVLSFIVGLAWFWYAHKRTTVIVLSNARTERVLFYVSLLALGVLYALTKFSVVFNWVDWVGLIVIVLSWFSAWMFAVHTNDLADIKIDEISNHERPLPGKNISTETMRDIGFVWLSLSLVGAYIAGYYLFYMNIIFLCAYYVYSMPPLRLKRVPLLSSFLISLACLATALAGFFFVAPIKMLSAFPVTYALGIIILLTLGVNIRDIKDIEGDRLAGIQTLPVIFGAQGKQVVGVLLALSFLLAPLFFPLYTTYFVAVPSAIIGYWLCVKKPYREILIFALFFVSCATSIIFYLITL